MRRTVTPAALGLTVKNGTYPSVVPLPDASLMKDGEMPERYKPREVYQQARKALGPYLREQGYRRSSKTGPGPSWERDTESGYLLFGVHAGPYLDLMGGGLRGRLRA